MSDVQNDPHVTLSPPPTSQKEELNMLETHCTLNESTELKGVDFLKPKLQPFKKIKKQYLDQKNNYGRVVHKVTHSTLSHSPTPKVFYTIENLQDALTIFSEQSLREREIQDASFSYLADESIGEVWEGLREQFLGFGGLSKGLSLGNSVVGVRQADFRHCYTEPNEEIGERRKIVLQVIRECPSLAVVQQTGMLIHFQLYQAPPKPLKQSPQNKNILQLYSIEKTCNTEFPTKLKNKGNETNKYIAFYEPFTETFTEFLLKLETIQYQELLGYIERITGALEAGLAMEIDPFNVVMVNGQIKLIPKLPQKQKQKPTQRQIAHSLGLYLSSHFKILYNPSGPTLVNKIKGMNIFKRQEIKQFIQFLLHEENADIGEVHRRARGLAGGL